MRANFRSEEEFIKEVAPAAQKACKRYGYLPSVLIAQACHENGYGIPAYWDNQGIRELLKYNNMVGQKAELLTESWADKSVWPGESFDKETPEQRGSKMVTIEDGFRIFDNIEQSFCDYLLFLLYASNYGYGGTPKYGPEVVNIKDPETLITEVKRRGYATGDTYPTAVMEKVRKHNLTKYDDLSKVTPSDYVPDSLKLKYGIKISAAKTEKTASNTDTIEIIDLTAQNTPVRWDNTREALVFHFLGVAGADNPYLYGGGYGGQWYISRKGKIYHAVKPGGTVYAVGSGGWGLKTTKWNNSNTENVEMGCECDGNKNDIFDKKWWFHMATQEAAVKFARYWLEMRGYGVSEKTVNERILVHNTITNKPCPAPWLHGAGYSSPREKGQRNWSFEEFKRQIWQGYNGKTVNSSSSSTSTSTKTYLSKGDSGSAVKTMQQMLIACGYSCGSCGADGDFGSRTEEALKAFQADVGLAADGMYGVKSKAALTAVKTKQNKTAEPKEEQAASTVFDGVDYAPVYNYSYYRKKYEDLQKAFGTDRQKFFEHFCIYGMKEGRRAASAFDVQKYRKRYADLQKAFGNDMPKYYKHYCLFGRKEGRKAT